LSTTSEDILKNNPDPIQQPTELRVDASYRNTNNWKHPLDEFNLFFRFSDDRGIANAQGFRPKSRKDGSTAIADCAFCLLVTNYGETEWPDSLNPESGLFTYYGDNRQPGKALNATAIGGNRLLERVFERLHDGNRASICPFLCFENYRGAEGVFMRFLGLAVPGAEGLSSLDDLVAVWRRKGNQRFQNYRATFTILNEPAVTHAWLDKIVNGASPSTAKDCPPAFAQWVKTGKYNALTTPPEVVPRNKSEQLPKTNRENIVLKSVSSLNHREFEHASAAILEMMDDRFFDIHVTREVRDGGRDVLAKYRVGHEDHSISLEVSLEAKHWTGAIGVKPMMRLISRLKHRDFGVFITTSHFEKTVQEELIEDGHPVVLIAGGDIARILISKELEGVALERWLDAIRNIEDDA
jgi:hypothetical protein